MTPEQSTQLRAPFEAEHVGLLPRITCGECSKVSGRCCAQHNKSKCDACGNYITERHIHLDYVGHGAVTDRLLAVDPDWLWEPLAFDPSGMPTFIYDDRSNPISFWIRLTVGGTSRLGVGTCPPGQPDAEKVLIGDALRNAAMRFGVALDLWIKGHAEDDEKTVAADERRARDRRTGPAAEQSEPAAPRDVIKRIKDAIAALPTPTLANLQGWVKAEGLPDPSQLTVSQADQVLAWLDEHPPAEDGEAA